MSPIIALCVPNGCSEWFIRNSETAVQRGYTKIGVLKILESSKEKAHGGVLF